MYFTRTQCVYTHTRVLYQVRSPPRTDVYCVGDERETVGSRGDRGREIVTGLKALTRATICLATAAYCVRADRLICSATPAEKPRHGSCL